MRERGKLADLRSAAKSSIAGSRAAGRMEDSHWLCPLEDGRKKGSQREGMLENFSLGSYLLLVDYTSRLQRSGKARLTTEVANIFERLGTSSEYWDQRLQKMFGKPRMFGNYFSTNVDRLRQIATHRGVHHVDNSVTLESAG